MYVCIISTLQRALSNNFAAYQLDLKLRSWIIHGSVDRLPRNLARLEYLLAGVGEAARIMVAAVRCLGRVTLGGRLRAHTVQGTVSAFMSARHRR